jgi:adenine-specific DNA methylase
MLPDEAEWEVELAETAVDQQSYGSIDPTDQYASILTGIFKECRRVMKENGRLIFTFHHRNPKGWAALTLALKRAGFRLINRYVVHAENPVSVHIANQNALLHDVILVLAPTSTSTTNTSTSSVTVEPVETVAEPVEAWKRPLSIPTDSAGFCYECGTAVGWTLNSDMDDVEIQGVWKRLLE